jgi:hypothetical protein
MHLTAIAQTPATLHFARERCVDIEHGSQAQRFTNAQQRRDAQPLHPQRRQVFAECALAHVSELLDQAVACTDVGHPRPERGDHVIAVFESANSSPTGTPSIAIDFALPGSFAIDDHVRRSAGSVYARGARSAIGEMRHPTFQRLSEFDPLRKWRVRRSSTFWFYRGGALGPPFSRSAYWQEPVLRRGWCHLCRRCRLLQTSGLGSNPVV